MQFLFNGWWPSQYIKEEAGRKIAAWKSAILNLLTFCLPMGPYYSVIVSASVSTSVPQLTFCPQPPATHLKIHLISDPQTSDTHKYTHLLQVGFQLK